jgi:hypothetical protein
VGVGWSHELLYPSSDMYNLKVKIKGKDGKKKVDD